MVTGEHVFWSVLTQSFNLLPSAVGTVRTKSHALPWTAHASPASLAGMVRGVTTPALLVFMVMAAKKGVHDAEIMNPVIKELGIVGSVTLDGLEPGGYANLGKDRDEL